MPILALVKAMTFWLLETAVISQFSISTICSILASNERGATQQGIRLPAINLNISMPQGVAEEL